MRSKVVQHSPKWSKLDPSETLKINLNHGSSEPLVCVVEFCFIVFCCVFVVHFFYAAD